MARVTVEDCIQKVTNRFELVMLASQRARKIGSGAPLLVDRDNDKNPVVALREIAGEKVDTEDLKEELIKNHQRVIEMDDSEDVIDMMEGEEEWSALVEQKNRAAAAAGESDFYEDEDEEDDEDEGNAALEDLAGAAGE